MLFRSDGWLCKLDLAGVRTDDLCVEVGDGRLRVAGVRRDVSLGRGWRHHLLEIAYSRFERVIELPDDLTNASVRLEHQRGMLLVWITTRRDAAERED